MPKRERTDVDSTVAKKERKSYEIVSKKPFSILYPVFFGHQKANVNIQQSNLNITPSGKHLEAGKENVCGNTPGGSELMFTPTKTMKIVNITPQGKHSEENNLYLLIRKKDYTPIEPTPVMSALFSEGEIKKVSDLSVTATSETRANQPKRYTQRSQRTAVGFSAADIAEKYFAMSSVQMTRAELEKERWNLCHLLSYGISKNAIHKDGTVFDPQVKENLYAGSRVFNENMMRIENVLLELLQEKNSFIEHIEYSAFPFIFENSHILAGVTLKTKLLMNDHSVILFEYHFDNKDNRRYSDEMSSALWKALHTLIDQKKSSEDDALNPRRELFP